MINAKIFGGFPLLMLAMTAHAGSFTFQTAGGATETGGNPVTAKAIVTTDAGAGSVTVQLFNLLVNPTTVAQNLSDFDFTLAGVTGGTLSSSSGQEIIVASNGSFTTGGSVATGWALSGSGSYILNVLGTATAPSHTIIGAPGGATYSNANSSIAGNGPHNPFLNQSATFTITGLTGLTANTVVSNAIFSYGTEAGNNVPGGGSSVPEPVSLSLVGGGLLALGLLRKCLPR